LINDDDLLKGVHDLINKDGSKNPVIMMNQGNNTGQLKRYSNPGT
jgi:hypothetical protein